MDPDKINHSPFSSSSRQPNFDNNRNKIIPDRQSPNDFGLQHHAPPSTSEIQNPTNIDKKAPSLIYDPAGYSKKAPAQKKREEVMQASRKGDEVYEDFNNKRKEKLR